MLRGCSGTWDLLRLTGSTICVGSELKILGTFSSHALVFTISALFGWVLNFEADYKTRMGVTLKYGPLFVIELNVGKRTSEFLEKVIRWFLSYAPVFHNFHKLGWGFSTKL